MEEPNSLTRSRSCDSLAPLAADASPHDAPVPPPTPGATVSSIRVVVRLKPGAPEQPSPVVVQRDGVSLRLHLDDDTARDFAYDAVLPPTTRQDAVFAALDGAQVAQALLDGINASVVLFGNTGSGKTYTCFGPDADQGTALRETTMGLAPRMLRALFEQMRHSVDEEPHYAYSISGSLLEVYNEQLRDLLVPASVVAHRSQLTLRKRGGGSLNAEEKALLRDGKLQVLALKNHIHIRNALAVPLESEDQAVALMLRGLANRVTAETRGNAESSRSHAIFVVTITRTRRVTHEKVTSQLYLCDLAGAESIGDVGLKGVRAVESSSINKSLWTLSQCISALADREASSSTKRVPFRDSLLTRILQNSLGGNARSTVICTLAPTSTPPNALLPSLRFGALSRNISNRIQVNRVPTPNELQFLLNRARDTIRQQQEQLDLLSTGQVASSTTAPTTSKAALAIPFVQLLDPLTQLPFEDCVVLPSDGYSYSRAPLQRWLTKHGTSPTLGTPAAAAEVLVPNRHLQQLVDAHGAALAAWLQRRDATLLALSKDTLGVVAAHLDGTSLYALSLTCTRLRRICLNRHLWHHVLAREFPHRPLAPHEDAYRVFMHLALRTALAASKATDSLVLIAPE